MISAAGVIIPARDEADLLPACIDSVAAAIEQAAAVGIASWCAVVLDHCRDGSLEIAEAARRRHGFVSVLQIESRNVGAARRRGIADLLERLSDHAPERTWVASTDADSVVPAAWLRDQIRLADAGSDVIAGTIAIDDWRDRPAGMRRRFAAHYRIEPDGSHEHVHGANLGFRASAYLAAGGVQSMPLSEDHALLDALALTGATVTRTATIEVVTSARRDARASGGFSELLTSLH